MIRDKYNLEQALERLQDLIGNFHSGDRIDYDAYSYLFDEIDGMKPDEDADAAVTPPPAL